MHRAASAKSLAVYLQHIGKRMDLNTSHFSGDVAVAQDERKKKEVKDNRNLYLAREGAIREGTKVFI